MVADLQYVAGADLPVITERIINIQNGRAGICTYFPVVCKTGGVNIHRRRFKHAVDVPVVNIPRSGYGETFSRLEYTTVVVGDIPPGVKLHT
ncbi:TPA: hypothetical protein ACGT6A_005087, partial [Salmonella enterica]